MHRRNGRQLDFKEQNRGCFSLVRQTHASFVDSMLLKAHLAQLDKADQMTK